MAARNGASAVVASCLSGRAHLRWRHSCGHLAGTRQGPDERGEPVHAAAFFVRHDQRPGACRRVQLHRADAGAQATGRACVAEKQYPARASTNLRGDRWDVEVEDWYDDHLGSETEERPGADDRAGGARRRVFRSGRGSRGTGRRGGAWGRVGRRPGRGTQRSPQRRRRHRLRPVAIRSVRGRDSAFALPPSRRPWRWRRHRQNRSTCDRATSTPQRTRELQQLTVPTAHHAHLSITPPGRRNRVNGCITIRRRVKSASWAENATPP